MRATRQLHIGGPLNGRWEFVDNPYRAEYHLYHTAARVAKTEKAKRFLRARGEAVWPAAVLIHEEEVRGEG
jgi:hypothetical protein